VFTSKQETNRQTAVNLYLQLPLAEVVKAGVITYHCLTSVVSVDCSETTVHSIRAELD